MIPSVAQCLVLMNHYGMLANIRAHSLMVGRVAGLLGSALNRAGLELSLELIISGALLHDIAKTQALGLNELRHDELGRDICLAHGFDELAEIVGQHVMLRDGLPKRCAEKEIVYYADKRVLHDRVVDLDARQAYVLERYSKGDQAMHQRIRDNFSQARLVEERLFCLLDFAPEAVAERVKQSGLDGWPEVSNG
ncbi:MAG: hypothetical protein A2505_07245 [Deltaproteobacteria bacterium RIFOXYD12_FULL_55_16]|nr:MAG: hypothetical protein A2505_07245 [Deltaproteobacteria bacterium RIFOXYD12_FULL_55_16]